MAGPVQEDPKLLALDERGRTGYVPNSLKGYLGDLKSKTIWHKQAKTLFYPAQAGYNDPLTVMCIIDLVMRLRPSDEIRAKYLSGILKYTHPQLVWNPTVVGVALAEMTSICEENFKDRRQCPIERTRDSRGFRFTLNPTTDGWKWLGVMRDFMGQKAELHVRMVKEGAIIRRNSSVWAGLAPRIADDNERSEILEPETRSRTVIVRTKRHKKLLEAWMERGNYPTSNLVSPEEAIAMGLDPKIHVHE